MDKFEKWWKTFTYKDDIGSGFAYNCARDSAVAAWKASREAGMREAVSIIRREQMEMTDPVFWGTAILDAIGGKE